MSDSPIPAESEKGSMTEDLTALPTVCPEEVRLILLREANALVCEALLLKEEAPDWLQDRHVTFLEETRNRALDLLDFMEGLPARRKTLADRGYSSQELVRELREGLLAKLENLARTVARNPIQDAAEGPKSEHSRLAGLFIRIERLRRLVWSECLEEADPAQKAGEPQGLDSAGTAC